MTNLFDIAKPTLELFNKRLNVTANRGVKVSTAPLAVFSPRNVRLEIVRLCPAVEKMGCRDFLHPDSHYDYETVNPTLKARAHDKFSAVYIFLFKLLFRLFTKTVEYVTHTAVGGIALKLKNPTLRIVFSVNSILRIILGEENFTSTMSYFTALPNRISNHITSVIAKKFYLPCRARFKRMQKASPFFAFVCRVIFYFLALMGLSISVVVGFISTCALDDVSLELVIHEQRSLAFIVNVEKAGYPGDSSGEDTTITYGCDDRNNIMKLMDAEDYAEILHSINRIDSADGVMFEGSDADVEDNIEEHDTLEDWEEEEWEWEESGKNILEEKVVRTKQDEIEAETEAETKSGLNDADCDPEARGFGNTQDTDHEELGKTMDLDGTVHEKEHYLFDFQHSVCGTIPRVGANNTILDSEDCSENIADIIINQDLSHSDDFIEEVIPGDEDKEEGAELNLLIGNDLFQGHKIIEASSCVTEETSRFRQFRFRGSNTPPPTIDYIMFDNIIATTADCSIDDITVKANNKDFGNHAMTSRKREMNTCSSVTEGGPIATIDPLSNDESANNCIGDSGPESGTLVGLGLAHRGFIFSDSQDLKDIEEMEAEKYFRGGNQQVMYNHQKFLCSHSKASSLDAWVGMKSLSRISRDFSSTTSSLPLSIFPLPSRADLIPPYWATAPAIPRPRRAQRSRHISLTGDFTDRI